MMSTDHTLAQRLGYVKSRFDIQKLLQQSNNSEAIKKYYQVNNVAYRIFHNRFGFMHMAISSDQKYHADDLYAQPKFVLDRIRLHKGKKVPELGAGHGVNSLFLAQQLTETKFFGLDLSAHLRRKTANYRQELGDYHDLGRYADNSFDEVFAIETICHSVNKDRVFAEVFRVLKPGGEFIIFDGYSAKPTSALSKDEQLEIQLTEKAMAVDKFEHRSDVETCMSNAGFTIVINDNLSNKILPSLQRFERFALS